jgi:hypothetical protein
MLMKMLVGMIVSALLLMACASGEERARINAVYDKYDDHCKEHAEKASGEPDVESRYQECMNYFVATDIHCPYCAVDKGMQK